MLRTNLLRWHIVCREWIYQGGISCAKNSLGHAHLMVDLNLLAEIRTPGITKLQGLQNNYKQ